MPPEKLSLGNFLNSGDLFCDFGITKTELTRQTNAGRGTIIKLDGIAQEFVADYQKHYPNMSARKLQNRKLRGLPPCPFDCEVPLTPYQGWVISRLLLLFRALRNRTRVIEFVGDNPDLFSEYCFRRREALVNQITA